MSKLINLTPHAVVLESTAWGKTSRVTVPASGTVARLTETTTHEGVVVVDCDKPVAVISKRFGQIEGLPEAEQDTYFIVSLPVATAAWSTGRTDVLAIGEAVRDNEGRIVAARSLACSPDIPHGRDVCSWCGWDNGENSEFSPWGRWRGASFECVKCEGN
jgi:hypothetical protein